MATGPALSIDIAEKRFDAAGPALFEGWRLDIAPSSVVALVGPSGIGKSTLLRMVAGIDPNFSGSIQVDGVSAAAAPTPGFVFQDPRLLPWLTAVENIRAVNPACSDAAASAALARVGLDGVGGYYPHQLSGGMQRRVALARALAVNARLLLLDEPFVSLDRTLVAEMHQLFTQLVTEARPTVLFVSHLIDDAARLADRAILLDNRPARIVADIALPVPRAKRDDAVLSEYRQLLTLA
ncbi:ABC transporter ATP-binding protein [Devosia sp. SL43]|uniref:ABC transporter ATP-binding protein n=1 Tax=Devosia sp. SL43 TaxID=2806348 RepID=UPI001F3DAD67|nr:ABC transporter ATP-binding protein [Devosia sp. SL43]UJW85850.1 ABC transporter ATP-binding protein [Devosia sp. SL43]